MSRWVEFGLTPAEAIVAAVDAPGVAGETIKIVDDGLPTQAEYVEALAARTDVPRTIPVPWPVMKGIAAAVAAVASNPVD